MLFISKVVTNTYGTVEPDPLSQTNSPNTRDFRRKYIYCDIYPAKEPVYWTIYNHSGDTTKIYIGEVEYYSNRCLGTHISEYDEGLIRYQLMFGTDEPAAGDEDFAWEPNILYMIN